jgi:hypothetical protein
MSYSFLEVTMTMKIQVQLSSWAGGAGWLDIL